MNLTTRILDVLAPAVFDPMDRWRRGDRSASLVKEVERALALPADRSGNYQLARLRAVADHAKRHTRFYGERFAEAGIDRPAEMEWSDLARLPFLTREEMRAQGEELASSAFPISVCVASATGGTTSSPVRFLLDPDSYWRRWAAVQAFDRWLGYRPGLRVAYLWGARQDWPAPSGWKQRLRSVMVTRTRYYPSALLDDAVFESYARDLAAFRPRLFQAYPTPLALFSEFLLRRGLRPEVGAVSCTAEPLLAPQRDTIRAAFGRDPVNWYGARECGRIAMECERHDGLHVNVFGLHVEVLPLPGMVDPGLGEVVVTDLWNLAFPLIRYRTGDLARFDPSPCACGRPTPRLRDIVGRTADVFVNSRGQRVPGVALPSRLVAEGSRVRAMQILQHDAKRFEVLVVPGAQYDGGVEEWLRERLASYMNDEIELSLRIVESIPLEPSGKARFAKNLMPHSS
jgi:phenylacetate-CoA ligase